MCHLGVHSVYSLIHRGGSHLHYVLFYILYGSICAWWWLHIAIPWTMYSNWELCLYRYHVIHKDVYKWFDISFDNFGRTSTPQQTEACQAIFKKLLDNNWLIENTMQQVQTFAIVFNLLLFHCLLGCICIYLRLSLTWFPFHSALLRHMQKVLSWPTCRGYLSIWRM